MAADSLKRIGDKICQDYLGFNPTSNSTKPPHIANGLFRACIGETCDQGMYTSGLLVTGERMPFRQKKS